jgi:heme-degrading monooxygenase HmoA
MHLATANVAIMLTGYEHPSMTDFVAQLDAVNATADAADGFVWRFVEGDDDTREITRIFGNDQILFNMSVWESVEALEAWVYSGQHLEVIRKRAEWFEKPTRSPLVLWWVQEGHIPTAAEARQRFDLLWKKGPSEEAFTFSSLRRTAS